MRKSHRNPSAIRDSKRAPRGAKSKDATLARKRARSAKNAARGFVR